MALDPYEQLGIPRDATAADIKRAYRSKVQALHPDKHPDDPFATTRFQQIQESYDILTDPVRRARYDAGEGAGGGNNLAVRALTLLTMVFDEIIGKAAQGGSTDVITETYRKLDEINSGAKAAEAQTKHRIARLERVFKRSRYKGEGNDLVTIMTRTRIDRLRADAAKATAALAESAEARKMLDEYESLPEEQQAEMAGWFISGPHKSYFLGGP